MLGEPITYELLAPGIIGPALGMVGTVSVYSDWVITSLISSFYLCVGACTTEGADLPLRFASMLLGCSATNQQQLKGEASTTNYREKF